MRHQNQFANVVVTMVNSNCDARDKETSFFRMLVACTLSLYLAQSNIKYEREQMQPTRMSNSFELNPISVTRFWMAKSTIITTSTSLSRLSLLFLLLL